MNGCDIRRYDPREYHQHLSGMLQGFSKFNSTFRENVGVGSVVNMASKESIETAVKLAQADGIVNALPLGLQTILDSPAFETMSHPGSTPLFSHNHGLSGGEVIPSRFLSECEWCSLYLLQWQRIGIARAFMRANDPEIDLLVFDEPVCDKSSFFCVSTDLLRRLLHWTLKHKRKYSTQYTDYLVIRMGLGGVL